MPSPTRPVRRRRAPAPGRGPAVPPERASLGFVSHPVDAPASAAAPRVDVALPAAAHDGVSASPPLVRAASSADLAYVVGVQKAHGDALGFIPRAALAQKIDLGRVHVALENGDPAGYLHHGSLAVPEVRVFQAAIQYDARRRHLGMALVADLLARAGAAGARAVSLRCLARLEANDFWRAAGFRLLDAEPGARGTLNVWGRLLGDARPPAAECPHPTRDGAASAPAPDEFPFHSRLHPCPRCGRWTTDTWARGARRFALCPACVGGRADLAR